MSKVEFQTIDGETVKVDSKKVERLSPGTNDASTRITHDGEDVVVLGTELEVSAALGINPLDVIEEGDDDDSIEELVEEGDAVLDAPKPTEEVAKDADKTKDADEKPAAKKTGK